MHVIRRRQTRKDGREVWYFHLRHGYRDEDGKVREKALHLGPEKAADLFERAGRVLRRRGYTDAERREILVSGLREIGFDCPQPAGTFYVWTAVPAGHTASSTTAKILEETGIVTTPGTGFGAAGEGYIRLTLTSDRARLAEAVERLRGLRF